MAEQGGFPPELFVKNISRHLLCGICHNVLNDVTVCTGSDCEHLFCKSCIAQWLQDESNCPACKQPVSGTTKPLRSFCLFIQELELKCQFEDRGCPDILTVQEYPRHIETCQYDPANPDRTKKEASTIQKTDSLKPMLRTRVAPVRSRKESHIQILLLFVTVIIWITGTYMMINNNAKPVGLIGNADSIKKDLEIAMKAMSLELLNQMEVWSNRIEEQLKDVKVMSEERRPVFVESRAPKEKPVEFGNPPVESWVTMDTVKKALLTLLTVSLILILSYLALFYVSEMNAKSKIVKQTPVKRRGRKSLKQEPVETVLNEDAL